MLESGRGMLQQHLLLPCVVAAAFGNVGVSASDFAATLALTLCACSISNSNVEVGASNVAAAMALTFFWSLQHLAIMDLVDAATIGNHGLGETDVAAAFALTLYGCSSTWQCRSWCF